MSFSLEHFVIIPVLLPRTVAAALLLFRDQHRVGKAIAVLATMLALLAVSIVLLVLTASDGENGWLGVYLLGNWSPVFGIVLEADRAAAVMVATTAVLGAAAMIFASARWNGAGPHFHSLFLFLIAGVNGAFLTGDLFNLFVFFEVMLAA